MAYKRLLPLDTREFGFDQLHSHSFRVLPESSSESHFLFPYV